MTPEQDKLLRDIHQWLSVPIGSHEATPRQIWSNTLHRINQIRAIVGSLETVQDRELDAIAQVVADEQDRRARKRLG